MHGTINSPELFNLYTYAVLTLFGLNSNNTHSVAFADDFIMLVADTHPKINQDILEKLLNKLMITTAYGISA